MVLLVIYDIALSMIGEYHAASVLLISRLSLILLLEGLKEMLPLYVHKLP